MSAPEYHETIRAALPYPPDDHHRNCDSREHDATSEDCDCYAQSSNHAHAALDALLAERQQLQQAATALSCDVTRLSEERQQAIDERDAALRRVESMHKALRSESERTELAFRDRDKLRAERQEAIDALRDIANGESALTHETVAAAALLKLGEKQ